jgi:hypothetical protein
MIHGIVNFRYELTLPVVVGNSDGKREFVGTVIDTGFDEFPSLPSESNRSTWITLANIQHSYLG